MTEINLKTRLLIKQDTWANWNKVDVANKGGNLVLKKGELAACFVPAGTTVNGVEQPETTLFKVGDGTSAFKDLPWSSALASDVPDWAKAAVKPSYTASDVGAVPTTRKINNKALSADISLTASDVGALPTTGGYVNTLNLRKADNGYSQVYKNNNSDSDYGINFSDYSADSRNAILNIRASAPSLQDSLRLLYTPASGTQTVYHIYGEHNKPTAADVGAVPTTRTVNNKALSANISLTAADVGARPSTWSPTVDSALSSTSTNAVQNKVVNTALSGKVPTTRKINNKALSADISLTASDVSAIASSEKGAASGVASLDTNSKVPPAQVPTPTFAEVTLASASWSSGNYSLEATYPVAKYDVEVALNHTATDAQKLAYAKAQILGDVTNNILHATGVTPTVDIPVIVKITQKN